MTCSQAPPSFPSLFLKAGWESRNEATTQVRYVHADHNIKRHVSYNMSFLLYGVGIMQKAEYYAKYLGVGMRYEDGICTIVISMNGAFQ